MLKHVPRVAPAVLLTLSWLPAQTGGDLQQQVDQQMREMRKQVVEGKTFRSHVRVTVHLKNGNTIRGVVKDSLLVERIDGLRFVAAEENEPGAGMRIYYWNGGNSYVFVPYADMRRDAEGKPDCKINERLTPAQLRDIELANKKQDDDSGKAHAAAQDQAAAQDTPPTDDTQAPKAADGTAKDPAGGLTKEQQDLFALVQEYPPQAGWCQDKRDEIARRLAVIGAKPSESELRFVARFADWLRACAMFHLTPTPPAAAAANGTTTANGSTAANTSTGTNSAASTSKTGTTSPSTRVAANNAANNPTPPPPPTNTSGSGSSSGDDSRSSRRSRRDQNQ